MKECPKCHSQWPDHGKFCPKDGTTLIPVKKEEPPSPPKKAVHAVSDNPKKTSRAFSETKWFLAGEKIKEEAITPEDIPVENLDAIYRKTGELPSDVRKKFSLTYKEKKDK